MSSTSIVAVLVAFTLATLMVVDNGDAAVAHNYDRSDPNTDISRRVFGLFPFKIPLGGYVIQDGQPYPGYGLLDPCGRIASLLTSLVSYYLPIPGYNNYYYRCQGRKATIFQCNSGTFFNRIYNRCM